MIITEKKVVCDRPMRNLMAENVTKLVQSGVASPVTMTIPLEAMKVQTLPRLSAVQPKNRVPTMPPTKKRDWEKAAFQASSQTQDISEVADTK